MHELAPYKPALHEAGGEDDAGDREPEFAQERRERREADALLL